MLGSVLRWPRRVARATQRAKWASSPATADTLEVRTLLDATLFGGVVADTDNSGSLDATDTPQRGVRVSLIDLGRGRQLR